MQGTTLTKLQKSGVFKKSSLLGIRFGRPLLVLNLGTGRRGLIPNNATAQQIDDPIAHIRRVQESPTLFRRPFRIKGKTKPVNRRTVSRNTGETMAYAR